MDTQKKEKTVGVQLVLGWIVGLLFIFLGVLNLFKHPIVGVFEILAALVIFPPSMQFLKDKTGVKLSAVLRIVIFFILIGIGVGLALSIEKTDNSQTTQTSAKIKVSQPTPTPTPIALNISEFIDAYDKNKIAVQSNYTAKRIQLTGFIENISSDFNQYYLEVAPTNDQYYFGTTIRCYFVNKSDLINFSKGESVTVVGTLQDTDYETWIELHDCNSVK